MSDAFIICSNLSFSWPDDTPVFQNLSFTVGPGRTGLVAPNGAGRRHRVRGRERGALRHGRQRLGHRGAHPRAQLDRLGLTDVALGRRLHTLSGGQVVSLGLAAQLLKQPDVLLLDEPTNNLDLVSVGQLESALSAYEGAFVVVSHDERFLAEIMVNRWLRLSGGGLLETSG
jgi:ATPase subunit of ABC transporter with duplicated ATPase domains